MKNQISKEELKNSIENLRLSEDAKTRIRRACRGREGSRFFRVKKWQIGLASFVLCVGFLCSPAAAEVAEAARGFTAVIRGTVLKTEEEANRSKGEDPETLKFPGRGFAYDACPWLDGQNNRITDEETHRQILDMTGLRLTAGSGTLYLEGEAQWIEDQKRVAKEQCGLPEIRISDLPYTKSWNGVRDFYFPDTYYPEGDFKTEAGGAHRVKIYAMDGAYAATVDAVFRNGKYVANAAVEGGDYYIVIFYDGEGEAGEASFTVR